MRGAFSRRDMLRPAGALAVGAAVARTSRADAAPPAKHRLIETNGIRLHVAEWGEGPRVILCHGFPECWYSWRHQLPALPPGRQRFCGPTVFRTVIALGVPLRPHGFGEEGPPTTLMPRNEKAVFYQLWLQTPEAESTLGRDIRRTFRSQLYALSGDRPSAVITGLGPGMVPRTGGRHRRLCRGVCAERLPRTARLVPQRRSQLGGARALRRRDGERLGALLGRRPGPDPRRIRAGPRAAVGVRSQAPAGGLARRLRPLDRAGASRRGQCGNDRFLLSL